jgi:hypothetical protein
MRIHDLHRKSFTCNITDVRRMILLDERMPPGQRHRLRDWRLPVRQIGHNIGRKGIQDEEIIPFLLPSVPQALAGMRTGGSCAGCIVPANRS